jgi:hypothetical protein
MMSNPSANDSGYQEPRGYMYREYYNRETGLLQSYNCATCEDRSYYVQE